MVCLRLPSMSSLVSLWTTSVPRQSVSSHVVHKSSTPPQQHGWWILQMSLDWSPTFLAKYQFLSFSSELIVVLSFTPFIDSRRWFVICVQSVFYDFILTFYITWFVNAVVFFSSWQALHRTRPHEICALSTFWALLSRILFNEIMSAAF